MNKDQTYFQDTWLSDDKYKDWLVSTGKNTQARCKRCKKTFELSNMGIQALESL